MHKKLTSKRREKRAPIAMPINMERASHSKPPAPTTGVTLDLTSKGARVQLQSDWQVGELIWVERRGLRAKFRVVWVGDAGSARQNQIGIECTEPEFDWGVPLAREEDSLSPKPSPDLDIPLA